MTINYEGQTALIYVMVVAAVADQRVGDQELFTLNEIAKTLPVFRQYPQTAIDTATANCLSLLDDENGLERILQQVKSMLPQQFHETAYALACDIIAADGNAGQAELRWLELLRNHLSIDMLHAAAIERGAKARYAR